MEICLWLAGSVILGESFWRFTLLVSLAKTGRYAVLAYITLYILE